MSPKNMAASVHARLAETARRTNRPFQELLQYYGMERFLYRLSKSPHAARFVLKGALMLRVWNAPMARPTKDIDLLGRLESPLENLSTVVREVCAVDVEPDGLVFTPATVKSERIREDADYESVRIRFEGLLGRARIAMQLDVGIGDVMVPGPVEIAYPTLLDFPAPRLKGYPRETAIAEKFEAMVKLGTLNSRMKDFYDIWILSRQFGFAGPTLAQAVTATFANRGTTVTAEPVALTTEFSENEVANTQWRAFVRKGRLANAPGVLETHSGARLRPKRRVESQTCIRHRAQPGGAEEVRDGEESSRPVPDLAPCRVLRPRDVPARIRREHQCRRHVRSHGQKAGCRSAGVGRARAAGRGPSRPGSGEGRPCGRARESTPGLVGTRRGHPVHGQR